MFGKTDPVSSWVHENQVHKGKWEDAVINERDSVKITGTSDNVVLVQQKKRITWKLIYSFNWFCEEVFIIQHGIRKSLF